MLADPLKRTLHLTNPLQSGADVKAAQGLLLAHMYLSSQDVDGVFGPLTAEAAKQAKWDLGYPDKLCLLTYGAKLYGYLSGTAIPADYAARAAARKKAGSSEDGLRAKIVANARWGVEHEADIHYSQGDQRMVQVHHPRHLPLYTDCSAFWTLCYSWAGAPDPNGTNYNGFGYTGSLLDHMRHIPRSMIRKGDLIVFGSAPGHHVVGAVEDGSDPMTVSHGMERGPLLIRLSDEMKYQPNPATALTLPSW